MNGEGMDRAWIEIDTDALAHNISALRGMLPAGCELSAVVKANAYGHGLITVSPSGRMTCSRKLAPENAEYPIWSTDAGTV